MSEPISVDGKVLCPVETCEWWVPGGMLSKTEGLAMSTNLRFGMGYLYDQHWEEEHEYQ